MDGDGDVESIRARFLPFRAVEIAGPAATVSSKCVTAGVAWRGCGAASTAVATTGWRTGGAGDLGGVTRLGLIDGKSIWGAGGRFYAGLDTAYVGTVNGAARRTTLPVPFSLASRAPVDPSTTTCDAAARWASLRCLVPMHEYRIQGRSKQGAHHNRSRHRCRPRSSSRDVVRRDHVREGCQQAIPVVLRVLILRLYHRVLVAPRRMVTARHVAVLTGAIHRG